MRYTLHKIDESVKKSEFKNWKNYSKACGYKKNSAGLFFRNNIERINKKLALIGLELDVKHKI